MRTLLKKWPNGVGLMATIVSYFLIFIPIVVIFILSINASTKGYSWEGFSLKWYQELFLNDVMHEPIMNTLAVAVSSTLISTILGTLFAIGINALTKKRRVQMMILNNIPVVNPDIVTGISLMIVFSMLGMLLGFTTVLIAHVFFSMPYVILSILPRLKRLDPNLYEAALDLGCSRISGVTKVILPNISTGIISGALMAFTMSIDDFIITYFTSGAEYMNVSTWLYSSLSRGRSFTPAAYAYNIIIFFMTIAIILFINLKSIRKEKNG
jgi:spermidine/putrescine transport system permease protein